MELDSKSRSVVIVGAGMAGLVAARALAERGFRPLVLEARNRVGGRICTANRDGTDVELGAEFVHGRAPELFALIDEASLTLIEREGAMLRQSDAGLVEDDPQDDSIFATLERLQEPGTPDEPFARWLERQDVDIDQKRALLGYVEGFNAADADRIGTGALAAQQQAEDAIEGDRVWHVRGGYAQVAAYLSQRIASLGGEVRYQSEVTHADWEPGAVRLRLRGGDIVAASRCVLTLPLGVLQEVNRGGMVLEPEPVAALAAARSLAMGHVVRFTLTFQSHWWQHLPHTQTASDALRHMSFVFTSQERIPVWWTREPEPDMTGAATLVGWCGGPRSQPLAALSDEDLAALALDILTRAFDVEPSALRDQYRGLHRHDWSADPFARGAYSYVPAGALEAPHILATPVADTLFFAGEHTDVTAHWGTVHAAMRSGLRVAEQILGDSTTETGFRGARLMP